MTDFSTIDPSLPDEYLAPGGRIGLVALGTDFNIEDDLRRIYPDDIGLFTSRVMNYNPITLENLRKMEPGLQQAAESLLPGTDLDGVIYACTSGTVAIGPETVERLIQETQPGVPVTTPATAAIAAMELFGAKKISVLTPYPQSVNEGMVGFFEEYGVEVLNIAGFGYDNDTIMTMIPLQSIEEAALEICREEADLLFMSCTALRAAQTIERLEAKLQKPVISSNQLLAWHSLKKLGYPRPVAGYGALLRDHLG